MSFEIKHNKVSKLRFVKVKQNRESECFAGEF